MMNFVVTILYFFAIAIHIGIFIFKTKKFKYRKTIFIKYLYDNNDIDTLYSLGVVRKDGVQESRRVTVTSVEDKLLEKYNQSKDIIYLDFDDFYVKYVKDQIAFVVLFMVLTLVYGIIFEQCS